MACSVKEFGRQREKELVDLTCEITLIPAPSRHEDARAAFCAQWLRDRGAKDVYIDADKNGICPICEGRSGKWIVIAAHTDTVFPSDTPLEIRREGDRLYIGTVNYYKYTVTVRPPGGTPWVSSVCPVPSKNWQR